MLRVDPSMNQAVPVKRFALYLLSIDRLFEGENLSSDEVEGRVEADDDRP